MRNTAWADREWERQAGSEQSEGRCQIAQCVKARESLVQPWQVHAMTGSSRDMESRKGLCLVWWMKHTTLRRSKRSDQNAQPGMEPLRHSILAISGATGALKEATNRRVVRRARPPNVLS